MNLKPVSQQTIVITGATSGIGLVTARRAAKRGARLVLAARNLDALQQLTSELRAQACDCVEVEADVGKREDVQRIGITAMSRFGGFDTWVNNAGVSIYGKASEVSDDDMRRLFDTNYWGVVYGSLEAVAHLKHRGGVLINLGSELSEVGIPLQSAFAASKHAVKGFTDSLRAELMAERAPMCVTLIRPAGIDTMYTQHAKNYMDVEPKLPPPVYAPEVVADAILFAAEHARRDIFVGAASRLMAASARLLPALTDRMLSMMIIKRQRSRRPARPRAENALHAPATGLRERSGNNGRVRESSFYTRVSLHPVATAAVIAVAAGAVLAGGQTLSANRRYR